MKTMIAGLILFALSHSTSFAQTISRSSLNALGGTVENNGIGLSQTFGQSGITSTFVSNQLKIRQGFQQPTTINSSKQDDGLNFIVFPNPNRGEFQLQFEKRMSGEITYSFYDNQGRLIDSKEMLATQNIHFDYTLPAGIYTLHLSNSYGKSEVTKIIIIP